MNAISATDAALHAARTFYDRHSGDVAVATTYGYFTHHPFARMNRKRLRLMAELVARRSAELDRPLRVLDLASGGGLITCALGTQGHNAVGLDLSVDEIRMARMFSTEEGLAGRFAQADLINDDWESEAVSLLAGKPDVVTLAYALHHLPPDRVATFVARLSGWLDPGAVVIVNEENPRSPAFRAKHRLRTRIQHDTDNEWHRTPTAWRSMFSAHGFDVDSELIAADVTPGVAALAPSVAWSVLFTARRCHPHPDPDQHVPRRERRDAFVPAGIMQRLAEGRDRTLADFWRSRIDRHEDETYAGIKMTKFPEDLRTYQRIIWERAPQVVIELGVHYGEARSGCAIASSTSSNTGAEPRRL